MRATIAAVIGLPHVSSRMPATAISKKLVCMEYQDPTECAAKGSPSLLTVASYCSHDVIYGDSSSLAAEIVESYVDRRDRLFSEQTASSKDDAKNAVICN